MVDTAKDAGSASEKIFLKHPSGASAQVQLYGGQVTSWKNDRGEELLFLSSKAVFRPPKAIRGGIPICFPQFGSLGSLDQHGFARNRLWALEPNPPPLISSSRPLESTPPHPPAPVAGSNSSSSSSSRTAVDLVLKPSEDDLKTWTHNFEVRLRVVLGPAGDLTMICRVRNSDIKPFTFTFALHTHLSVSDISEVRIEGLETLDFLDNLQERERRTEQGDALTFDCEVDRIYLSTPSKIAVIDHERKRTFVLRKDGLPDAVVWNPWEKKAKALADFGDEEYKHMLCVAAAATETPITLKPGEEWRGRQELSAVPSSYFSGQLDAHYVLQGS